MLKDLARFKLVILPSVHVITADHITVLSTSDETVGDKVSAEPIIWTHEHGKGRVVASTLGRFDWTFDDLFFHTILLRAIAWATGESPYRFDSLILCGIPLKD